MNKNSGDFDLAIQELAQRSLTWRRLPQTEKITILNEMLLKLSSTETAMSPSVLRDNVMKVQRLHSNGEIGAIEGSMSACVFYLLTNGRLKALIDSMKVINETQHPPNIPVHHTDKTSGLDVLQVYPSNFFEKMSFPAASGVVGELWMRSKDGESSPSTTFSSSDDVKEGFTVVLGAGNQEFLALFDILDRLFLHNEVVLIKHHPLRPHLHDVYSIILSPLIERKFVVSVKDGGLESNKQIMRHPSLRHIHLTGGNATHDAIVSSLPGVQSGAVSFTCELGCVTPWIFVPDHSAVITNKNKFAKNYWDASTLRHHARTIIAAVKANGSANCLAPKVAVISADWEHKAAFLSALRDACRDLPASEWYYPGAESRFEKFQQHYGERFELFCKPLLDAKESKCALIHIPTPDENEYALVNEAFAPVLAIVEVPSSTLDKDGSECSDRLNSYLKNAAKFCNAQIWGSLSCTVICPAMDGPVKEALEECVSMLEYGHVAVNLWTAISYGIHQCVWGAYPGKYAPLPGQGGSGCGFVGNSLFQDEDRIMKSVSRCAFLNEAVQAVELPPQVVVDCLTCAARQRTFLQAVVACTMTLLKALLVSPVLKWLRWK